MTNDIIQVQYDKLQEVAARFGRQAEATAQMQGRVQQSLRALQAGGWEGRGSAAFSGEMNDTVLPATMRLQEAMQKANEVTRQIAAVLRQAEQEASIPFKGGLKTAPDAVSVAGQNSTEANPVTTAANVLGQILKGIVADTIIPSRYVLRALTPNLKAGKSSVAMLMDMLAGKPGRGLPLIRFDMPHDGAVYPHININPSLTGMKDPHLQISPALLEFAGRGARALETVQKIALPVAIAVDVFRLGSAYHNDGNTVGEETKTAIGGVAGSWAGACEHPRNRVRTRFCGCRSARVRITKAQGAGGLPRRSCGLLRVCGGCGGCGGR